MVEQTDIMEPTYKHDIYYSSSLVAENATIAVASLSQCALDFEGNYQRIVKSLDQATAIGARLRTGPELEITGYDCNDHFLEWDLYLHSWQVLLRLLRHKASENMMLDFGMPVQHNGANYNCRVIVYNHKIVLIRPKQTLANDGMYRETRWFASWHAKRRSVDYKLPIFVQEATGQRSVPFGDCIVSFRDALVGFESCEELWATDAPHVSLGLAGVDVILNSSASHFEPGKLRTRRMLVASASRRVGGLYVYTNIVGTAGGARMYFDGAPFAVFNGAPIAHLPAFQASDVETMAVSFALADIRAYRCARASSAVQASLSISDDRAVFPQVDINLTLGGCRFAAARAAAAAAAVIAVTATEHAEGMPQPLELKAPAASTTSAVVTEMPKFGMHALLVGVWTEGDSEKVAPCKLDFFDKGNRSAELVQAAASWLWDYLRRCKPASGFIVALSGGLDSCAVTVIVYVMCLRLYAARKRYADDLCRVCRQPEGWEPASPRDLTGQILHTLYMPAEHSSEETKLRAQQIAHAVGANHYCVPIANILKACMAAVSLGLGLITAPWFTPDMSETMARALQNLQARMRMVLVYLFAQLIGAYIIRKCDLPPSPTCSGSSESENAICNESSSRYANAAPGHSPLAGVKARNLAEEHTQNDQVYCNGTESKKRRLNNEDHICHTPILGRRMSEMETPYLVNSNCVDFGGDRYQSVSAPSPIGAANSTGRRERVSVTSTGTLLTLGAANADESLRGYFTKYDCSAADLNPIGTLAKRDVREMVEFVAQCIEEDINKGCSLFGDADRELDVKLVRVLRETVQAVSSAELLPPDVYKALRARRGTDAAIKPIQHHERAHKQLTMPTPLNPKLKTLMMTNETDSGAADLRLKLFQTPSSVIGASDSIFAAGTTAPSTPLSANCISNGGSSSSSSACENGERHHDAQADEEDMGITYRMLARFNALRARRCGPYGMFVDLIHSGDFITPREAADAVRKFWGFYAANRHKTAALTPACHLSATSTDDSRFDMRPVLYPDMAWQWACIDAALDSMSPENLE